jgi:hypothetical protein
MSPPSERGTVLLIVVNLTLQLFDGIATYIGLHAGLAEGNPLLAWMLRQMGPEAGLCLMKLQACACLLFLWYARRNQLVAPALVLSAAIYVAGSLAPWAAALVSLHLDM